MRDLDFAAGFVFRALGEERQDGRGCDFALKMFGRISMSTVICYKWADLMFEASVCGE